jgi:hypothetical protein
MMKKIVFFFAIAAMTLCGADAFAQPGKMKVTTVGGPMLTPDKIEHNYGTIKKASDGNCVFTIYNTGDQPLIISNCQGSCGCTTPQCDKTPIASGGFTEIKVHYDTMRLGPFTKTVTVMWNGPEGNKSQVLTIKGEVIE